MNEIIKKISVDGVEYDIQGKELTKVSYAELKSLRDNGELVEGHLYRITDYEFTTVQSLTKSAGHVFDIIVLATSANELSHIARATAHEGDTYFDGNDLGAWKLWYDLDNDTDKYRWADATNGKGVIYRMIDEFENDCPFDFKNLLIYSDYLKKYVYTIYKISSSEISDASNTKSKGNKICALYISNCATLGLNVISGSYNTVSPQCQHNSVIGSYSVLGVASGDNIVSSYCIIGDECYYCNLNANKSKIGRSCENVNIYHYPAQCGNNCKNILLESMAYPTIGNNCVNVTIQNTVGSDDALAFMNVGNGCSDIVAANKGINNIVIESGCNDIYVPANTKNTTYKANGTIISKKDEYYDDGSGQLVPVKHPDLSTQPSILPYKFMGNYVYEQLIPHDGDPSHKDSTWFTLQDIAVQNPTFLEAQCIMNDGVCPCDITSYDVEFEAKSVGQREGIKYIRVVYTSMPEDSSYYYDDINLPSTGYVFKVPQSYGITDVAISDGTSGMKSGELVSQKNGYDYLHIDEDPKKENSSIFRIAKDMFSVVDGLKAKVYKNFNTDVTNLVDWKQLTDSGYYIVTKATIPNISEMTSLYIEIL